MLTIDIHTHILPENLPDFGKKFRNTGFIRLEHDGGGCKRMMRGGEVFRKIDSRCWDMETRLNDCGKFHVDKQVLSTVPVMFSYWAKPEECLELSKYLNDHIAEVVNRCPEKFIGLGTLPMQDSGLAVKELERCMKNGLQGVEIGTHINDWNLSNPKIFPVFQAAVELGAAIFVHPWDMFGQEKMQGYWRPWLVGMPAETSLAICSMIFGGVFERLPKLRVAFAHGGGAFPGTIGRIEHGFHVRPDLVAVDNNRNPREYLGRFWVDTLTHDAKMLDYIIELFGANRVAMGSDYPFPLGETEPGKLIRNASYSDKKKEILLGGAAMDWLGIRT